MTAAIRATQETLVTPAAVNITVTLPASAQIGDYMLISLLTNGGTTTLPVAGWTTIDTEVVQANPRHHVLGRLRQSGDPTTVGITVTSVTKTAIAVAVSNVDQVTPVDVISTGGTNSTGSGTMTAADMTTTVADTLLVYFGGANSSSATFTPGASGMTEVVETSAVKKQALYTQTIAAAGATGTRAAACSSNTIAWTAIMLALRPGAAPPATRQRFLVA